MASKKKAAAGKKAPARKTSTRKAATARKTPARKKVAKKSAVGKKTVKKAAAKKTPVKKATAKKTTAKKKSKKEAATRKPTQKKTAAKKGTTKKTAPKKTTAKKKAATRKTSAKKTATRKTTTGTSRSSTVGGSSRKVSTQSASRRKTSPRKPGTGAGPITTTVVEGIAPYQPRKGEEYMNEAQKAHFRNILLAWKRELMLEVDRTVHHMQDEAANFPDPNDRATQESEFSMELRTRDRERKLIKKIDETLQRLENDDYGYCDSCGVEIGIRRLEARPTATLCIDCKTLDEIRERQMGG